jgi:hypothetical protein
MLLLLQAGCCWLLQAAHIALKAAICCITDLLSCTLNNPT